MTFACYTMVINEAKNDATLAVCVVQAAESTIT